MPLVEVAAPLAAAVPSRHHLIDTTDPKHPSLNAPAKITLSNRQIILKQMGQQYQYCIVNLGSFLEEMKQNPSPGLVSLSSPFTGRNGWAVCTVTRRFGGGRAVWKALRWPVCT